MPFNAAMERLTATANKLAGEDEATIRDLLLFILNAHYQGLATGETLAGLVVPLGGLAGGYGGMGGSLTSCPAATVCVLGARAFSVI